MTPSQAAAPAQFGTLFGTLSVRQGWAAIFLTAWLSACAGPSFKAPPLPSKPTGAVKIGKPYKIAGVWYYPKADPYYDRTGMASWYGPKFHGKQTANGERYDMWAMTAAHTTLPMPSLVRVTNLQNARSVVLRVNDRGPYARGRIIDLSRRAAQILGFEKQGVTRVRVQAVDADGRPRKKRNVAERSDSVETGAATPTGLYVHAGSYLDPGNATRVAAELDGIGPLRITRVEIDGELFYRVRVGPLSTIENANTVLNEVMATGDIDARIVVE
ncbi:MAG: septal ring lytic transglycosylase RlpA family protein [Sphingomonadales bacterium]